MNDRIILQIVRRGSQSLELLVRPSDAGWALITAATVAPDLPVETALQTAEAIYGDESVCSLWKLGKTASDGSMHHVFCLDQESVGSDPLSGISGIWVDEQQFFQDLPADFAPLMAKILLIK